MEDLFVYLFVLMGATAFALLMDHYYHYSRKSK